MEQSILSKLLSRYSSLTKIQRIIAYGRRFYLPRALKEGLTITPIEMEEALNKLIYMDQQENFPGLADNLRKRGTITLPKWKHLLALAPFVDSDGLIKRSKWRVDQPNLKLGEVVLVLDEAQLGNKWVLGQVSEIHPGGDGRVRRRLKPKA
uniref:Uncharacterized protein n=1 Tax=Phlebotomus papatasi TaxID=29031 RepID=A0A1B0GNN6_PHLPP